ncbi:hypothetical protein PSENEW3n2_00000659 [Picochlorum sp. SENEW3]|nr:hypothetical protein PSENEW3n2_00000659 [Picochlorum sp. SENEW3]WPT15580.1 hypothetical protein PSENEW3_00000659 [Picochlorum sp. SENEW3]
MDTIGNNERRTWTPLKQATQLLEAVERQERVVCFCTGKRCKQVEPKVEGFPEEYRSDGIGFYSIDVESVDDAEVLPQDVCVIPMFLVYNQGVLRESVSVPQKRPARSVAQALKRVFHLPHSQD